MQNTTLTNAIINAALVLLILITGIILHKTGKPYNNLLSTVHKLATVVLVVLICVILIQYGKAYELNPVIISFLSIACLSLAALLLSGGFLSLDKRPDVMLIIHRISVPLFIVGLSGIFYIIFNGG